MKRSITIIFSCLFLIYSGSHLEAQWSQDFTGGVITDWQGDVNQFVVNTNGQLQLNAPDAGEAYIYRESTINSDTVSLGFFHLLDFSPSDNNQSTISLALDNSDVSIASGYQIVIGENGSNDAIKFYYLNNGSQELISTATMGAMASDPAQVRIDIDIFPNGLWSVKTNYNGEVQTSLDLEFVDGRFSFNDSQYFGIGCKFSASRSDKFFYDDMFLKAFEKDTTPPTVTSAQAVGPFAILLSFDEPVDLEDANIVDNYMLDNGLGNPNQIIELGILDKDFILEFTSDFDPSIDYTLMVSGISDLNGNEMEKYSFQFNFPVSPVLGDIQLSEILFDPYTGGEDFIEIYNASNKYIKLFGVDVRNDDRDETKTLGLDLVVSPKSYLAIGEDIDFLIQTYKPDSEANIAQADIPAFNNDEGNVMLIAPDGTVLDSFDYNEDFHFQLIDDVEGVSLERVSFEIETNNSRNWQSASQNVRFATPGYMNSSEVRIDPSSEQFEIVTETFSPNQDGQDDVMILNYNLDKSQYVANISVHDAAGFKIKELSRNELLGTQGIITWDGTNEEGNISDLGIYIIVGSLFHTDGNVLNFKKTAVLADFID